MKHVQRHFCGPTLDTILIMHALWRHSTLDTRTGVFLSLRLGPRTSQRHAGTTHAVNLSFSLLKSPGVQMPPACTGLGRKSLLLHCARCAMYSSDDTACSPMSIVAKNCGLALVRTHSALCETTAHLCASLTPHTMNPALFMHPTGTIICFHGIEQLQAVHVFCWYIAQHRQP